MYRIDPDTLGIILTLDNVTRVYYRFHPQTQITLVPGRLAALNERCETEESFSIDLSVYPSDRERDVINFTVQAENKGLIITK